MTRIHDPPSLFILTNFHALKSHELGDEASVIWHIYSSHSITEPISAWNERSKTVT